MALTLYDNWDSGNGYKVRLALAHLGLSYRLVDLDTDRGETRTPDFLAINPNGKIPAVVFEDGRILFESNAILCYLAEGSTLMPAAPFARAQVLQWLFFEQYSHEPQVAVARYIRRHLAEGHSRYAELPARIAGGNRALGVMEGHLAGRDFLVGEGFSVADIGLYAYTHVAAQGGFDLGQFPAVQAWCARVAGLPGHVPMLEGPPQSP
ncbi:MAG: glutathione S-transferase family protein [Alphaproteobacteria bacterium]|nr:glutathione S-transferase family protein [Alphaproteobacteria bacterium]MCB9930112.1 glutathione S-transferase family protein [Alphaproteobacteria bacterium]